MRRPILALALMLPACSGCACCSYILNGLLGGDSTDDEIDRQHAIFAGYENDRKWMDGKESNAWNASTLP